MTARDIDRFPLLAHLDPARKQRVSEALRWRDFGPGEVILGPDDDGDDVFFLDSGQIFAVHWTEGGREIIFAAIPEAGYFGELMAIDGVPRSLSVYARSAVRLAILPAAVFRDLMDVSADFRQAVLVDLARKIRELTERNCQLTTFSVLDRLKAFILRSAARSGRVQSGDKLPDLPTHAEIAARIGANREAVSRAFSILRRSGIITGDRRGGLRIGDPQALLGVAGGDAAIHHPLRGPSGARPDCSA